MGKNAAKNQDQADIIQNGDDNRITQAVVYTDQAYIKREVRVIAKKALNRFLIEVQAFTVDVDSVQAKVHGKGEIFSVQYREIPVKHATQDSIRELESDKEQLERQRQALCNEKDVGVKQVKFLDSVIGFAEKDLPQKIKTQFPTTENIGSMLEFLGANYQKFATHNVELHRQIGELDKEIALIDRLLKKSRTPQKKFRKVIEVVFNSNNNKQQDITIEVSYVARNYSV